MASMETPLKDYLKALGVSDKTVADIETEEICTMADLQAVVSGCTSMQELRAAMKITLGAAAKIWKDQQTPAATPASAATPEPATTAAPAAPATPAPAATDGTAAMVGALSSGLGRLLGPDKMSVRELIVAIFVDREIDPEYRQALRQKTNGANIYAVEPSTGQFNMDATMRAFEDWTEYGEIGYDITHGDTVYVLNSLSDALAKQAEADPMDGTRLRDGVSTKTRADWSKVSRDRRIIAAFGALYCRDILEGINSRDAAKELSEVEMPAHWAAVNAQVESSKRLGDGKYETAMARLIFRRSGSRPGRSGGGGFKTTRDDGYGDSEPRRTY